jgi:hypothetical protein
MKYALIGAAMILGLLAASRAEAGILYSTTDLGQGYTLESNATQQILDVSKPLYGVANANGSVVYAFDKSSATYLDGPPVFLSEGNSYQVLTMQSGSHVASYIDTVSGGVDLRYPSFTSFNGDGRLKSAIRPTHPQSPISIVRARS